MGAKNSGGGGGILRGKPGGGGVMGKIGDEMMGAISGSEGGGAPAEPANPEQSLELRQKQWERLSTH